MRGAEPTCQIVLLADCRALRVGEIRIAAGHRELFAATDGAAAVLFSGGEGSIVISECAHAVRPGSVEVVCHGEPCTISASRDLHAYVVIAKESRLADS